MIKTLDLYSTELTDINQITNLKEVESTKIESVLDYNKLKAEYLELKEQERLDNLYPKAEVWIY